MDKVDQIVSHAEQYCQNNGTRLTQKRKQVLSALVRSAKALSAYDLIASCEQYFGEKIAAMSVYRILDFLVKINLVHKLKLANKYVACSHISCDHAHRVAQFLICGNCHQVKEIHVDNALMAELKNNVECAGFHLVSPQLEMNCICDQCALSGI